MEKNLYLIKKTSTKAGKESFAYVQLYADLGYTKLVVSFDKNVIAELLGVSVQTLFQNKDDVPVLVGKFTQVSK